tara:strand:+ start:131 stop:766 length:636 start_codon:yes stop_codon:yes gene_type:complete
MDIKNSEEILFKKWQKKRPRMAKDGVVNDMEYNRSSVKILFILKEVNGWPNGDLRELLNRAEKWRTWNNISRWNYGVQSYFKTGKFDFKNKITKKDRKEILKNIAVINLKKASGGSSSNMGEIRQHALEDKELLKEQVNLYTPDLVICCGTGNIIPQLNLFEKSKYTKSSEGVVYSNNSNPLIINYLHPQCMKGKRELFDTLMNCIKEIKQ